MIMISMRDLGVMTASALFTGLCTWGITKLYYDKRMNEEIASVKQMYLSDPEPEKKEKNSKTGIEKNPSEKIQYSNVTKAEKEAPVETPAKPYGITDEEFIDRNGYDKLTWTYYSDGVLVDDNDDPVADPGSFIGANFEEYFDKYEPGVGYIRNDYLSTDYEIVIDHRTYAQIIGAEV